MQTATNAKQQLTGYALFQKVVKDLQGADSWHEAKMAGRFNAASEYQRQVWLKAAGVPLLTDFLAMGGKRITRWEHLRKEQKNRVMSAFKEMKELVKGLA